MKKFLAILLAMMLVMVSVAALATSGTGTGTTEGSTTEGGTTTGGTTTGGTTTGGTTTGGTTTGGTTTGGGDSGSDPLKPYVDKKDPSVPKEDTAGHEGDTVDSTVAFEVPFNKIINVKDYQIPAEGDQPAKPTGKTPVQNLKFIVDEGEISMNDSFEGDVPAVTIGGGDDGTDPTVDLAAGKTEASMTIHIPSYSAVGVYTYNVTEKDAQDETNGIAGITYGSFELKVTVLRNTDTKNLYVAGIAIRQAGTKTDEIDNEFAVGSLLVTKNVAGNMGDRNYPFPINVTFKSTKTVKNTIYYTENGEEKTIEPGAWDKGSVTVQVELANEQTAQFDNIPADVTYTVIEDSKITHNAKADDNQDKALAYLVEGEKTDQKITAAELASETIKNTKNVNPDTGITLETLPYVLMMALAMMGLVALKLRKREEY